MKIGILTLSASDNCGSLLQTYALQELLKNKYGHEVKVIDFRSEKSEEMYSIFPKKPWIDRRVFVNALLNYSTINNQRRAYEKFRQDLLFLTKEKYSSESELKKLDGVFDAVVSGSDQVWNVTMFDHSPAFFLAWNKKGKNVSYAASLGGHKFDETGHQEEIRKWLNNFSKISVREVSGISYVNDFSGRNDVELCVDPTLLIESDNWKELAGEKLVEGDYIFYYSWAYNSDYINRIVEYFAKSKNLPVYVINASKWIKLKPKQYGFNLSDKGGPSAFLSLMKYAKYALVQSFHGVIFSYQMRKDFWFLDDLPKDKMDSRLSQILQLLHAEDRVFRSIEDVKQRSDEKYNYNMNLDELDLLKGRSFDFLKSIEEI